MSWFLPRSGSHAEGVCAPVPAESHSGSACKYIRSVPAALVNDRKVNVQLLDCFQMARKRAARSRSNSGSDSDEVSFSLTVNS